MKPNRQNLAGKTITILLILQILLIGIEGKNRIQQGDSAIETLLWMINQYIPVLLRASRLLPSTDSKKPHLSNIPDAAIAKAD
ncbi:hypothetical protein Cylst_0678 [Cylindrospermum stagnale PCC 7417]|uniref:Uncharacterized protein n=1 Tax=Cylindrospermum stagnale PCC 7417 TaxID=56107 RepID=K9WT96_9NOST|nr:hypothetical protein [Cylindrospermum stagnale]AFZ23006.1 hypothetical protein Cylst_0678 [Cylindrospermum stagnale PCC 7417]